MLDKYGAIIVTEDDNVFSPCFLDYMDKCLEKYKDDDSIVGISGYTPPINIVNNNVTVFKHCDPKPWGYGIWKDKEKYVLEELSHNYLKVICDNKMLLSKFENDLAPIYALMQWSANSNLGITSDIYRYCYNIANDKYTIHPTKSLVRNEGQDGSGVHCGDRDIWNLSKQEIISSKNIDIVEVTNSENNKVSKKVDDFFKSMIFQNMQQYNDAKIMYELYLKYGYEVGNKKYDEYKNEIKKKNEGFEEIYKEIDLAFERIVSDSSNKINFTEKLSTKKIKIFGKGVYGRKTYLLLHKKLGIKNIEMWDNIDGLCDLGKEILTVKKPSYRECKDDYIIITPVRYYEEISKQLETLGDHNEDYIFIYDLVKDYKEL